MTAFQRTQGRAHDALRPVRIERGYTRHAEGSVLVSFGQRCCHPTSPRCTCCPLADFCPRLGVTRSR